MNPLPFSFPAPEFLGSPAPNAAPRGVWQSELQAAAEADTAWLWHGLLRRGSISLLTSQWKSGKTTLAAVFLARMKTGGQLAELPVAAGKALVVSEEALTLWHQRSQKLDFGDHVCWFCRPFAGRPRREQWQALLGQIGELHAQHQFALVMIDPLASLLPVEESLAGSMLEALLPLQRLAEQGLAVWLLHHPAKGETLAGQSARGSGALMGCVDILIEMQYYGHAADEDRRRRLQAWSRYEETPRRLVIELNAEGTDYRTCAAAPPEDFLACWPFLQTILAGASSSLTQREILRSWPSDSEPPSEVTLWRWLRRAAEHGLLRQEGTGRRNDAFRYGLAE